MEFYEESSKNMIKIRIDSYQNQLLNIIDFTS